MSKVQDLVYINGAYYPSMRDMAPEEADLNQESAEQLTPELTPAEQREQAYNTAPCVSWDGAMLTVTEAAQQWAYYAAEGRTDKTDALTALIAAAKAYIRKQYPDEEGGT